MFLTPVTYVEIISQINNLKNNSANGDDNYYYYYYWFFIGNRAEAPQVQYNIHGNFISFGLNVSSK